jgi:D-beta-D-heptose 7-phosphate kinase/D-beta-D-heptose 1-phosphate adenosyltransferase
MKSRLLRLLPLFSSFRVAIVGDVMLDRYIWGRASRISQEAPVPIVTVERETQSPGGAANVVRNVLGLGARAIAFGVTGADERGRLLGTLLREAGADTAGLLRLRDRMTTVKTRVIAGTQQVVRIDREATAPLEGAERAPLERRLLACIRRRAVDAVIFEDYAKGMLTNDFVQRITDAAREHKIVVTLDPHPSHPFRVRGLHMMTPNRAEAFGLAGVYYQRGVLPLAEDRPLLEVAANLHQQWGVEALLITLGAGGMALFRDGQPPVHIPTRAREVFDVSGAGDTVTAAYTLALLAGATAPEAAELANTAAGVVVAKIGTVPIEAAELAAALRHTPA